MPKEIVTVADLCADLLFVGNVRPVYGQVEQFVQDYTVELGGSAAIFSSQVVKLGGHINLIGKVGDDIFGNFLIDRLRTLNVPPTYVTKSATEKTAIGLGLADNDDRAMLTYLGAMKRITAGEILSTHLLEGARHFHIASYYLMSHLHHFWTEQIPRLKKNGATISLDTNWSPLGDWHKVHAILPLIDVFLPNEQEALHISGCASIAEAARWLGDRCPLTIIKCGAAGALIVERGSSASYKLPEYLTRNLKIADTTGAGDNFDAGCITAWLSGKSLADCALDGMICGTLSLHQIGGISGQCTHLNDVQNEIRKSNATS